MIPSPYGGRLVERQLGPQEAERLASQVHEFPQLRLETDQVLDAAKIAVGAYSPLDGFMDRATLESVVHTLRLPNSLPWPIPIVLTPPGREAEAVLARLRPGDEVALLDPAGRFFALLHFRESYPLDRTAIARGVYGTTDVRHPNVAALGTMGGVAVAGRVDLVRPPEVPLPELEFTPAETRALFARNGWQNVAGFQTRNVPHAGHEQLQRMALERDDVDALFVHPVVGPLKPGDYRPQVVADAYRAVLREYYPAGRVALGTLSVSMRYAGPRAALFFAIVRRNYGCSHYIVGRDQAGVGSFYKPYACHEIFDQYSVGITPLRYREMAYCTRCGQMASEKSCGHRAEVRAATSQTRVRTALAEGGPLPLEILRPEVAAILRQGDPILGTAVAAWERPVVPAAGPAAPPGDRRPTGPLRTLPAPGG
ncbi:MAG: sulfate adenylyltransferase [Thermoplasmata archaeon]|nr:sulfate adenylyltransferase [Thermoplasmata archaeon]MCI4332341.1 sulfate adenylyltransferase [Thermoplasmata archaeon]MCI4367483.1 sulfate adenylyltransferase [Thermoplasmata archaeon]